MLEKAKSSSGSIRPTRLPQVNQFLQQHGIKNVRLERGHGYFSFWGMPIDKWLNRVVVLDRLDALTLNEWLEKFRQLEKQHSGANLFQEKQKKKRK